MQNNRFIIKILVLWLTLFSQTLVAADTATWLQSQQLPNGSIYNSNTLATDFQASSEAAITFRTESVSIDPATSTFIQTEPYTSTEYLSRKIIHQQQLGQNTSDLLTNLFATQNRDGGFGELQGFQSTPLDTAFALQALTGLNNNPNAHIARTKILTYLRTQQLSDGSFPALHTNDASIYVTALCLQALQQLPDSDAQNLAPAAENWLKTQQQTSGWGSDWETALALLALIPSSGDLSSYTTSVQTLRAHQDPQGSWNQDVYTTALAERALQLFSNTQQFHADSVDISNLQLDQNNYSAHSPVELTLNLHHPGPVAQQVYVQLIIHNAQGQRISSETLGEDSGYLLQANEDKPLNLNWNSSGLAPGRYQATVQIIETSSGRLVFEGHLTFNIDATQQLDTLTAQIVPDVAYVDLATTVILRSTLNYRSNAATQLTLDYRLKRPDGSLLRSGSQIVAVDIEQAQQQVTLDRFDHTFTQIGDYVLELTSRGEVTPNSIQTGQLTVLDGIQLQLIQSITPQVVAPEVGVRAKIRFNIQGQSSGQ